MFLGVYQRVLLAIIFCEPFILVTVVDQMTLGPVSCPAKIHCTVDFAQRNSKFLRLAVTHFLSHPFGFAPDPMHAKLQESWPCSTRFTISLVMVLSVTSIF